MTRRSSGHATDLAAAYALLAALAIGCSDHASRRRTRDASPDDAGIDAALDVTADDADPRDAGRALRDRDWSDADPYWEIDPAEPRITDAGAVDEPGPTTLAPRCEHPEADPLLEVREWTLYVDRAYPPGLHGLLSIVPDDAEDAADVLTMTTAVHGEIVRWDVARIDAANPDAERTELEARETFFPSGGAARTTDGALLVAWRRGGDREGLGTSAHVALVHDGAVTDGPEMHLSRPAVGVANAVPVVLADDELLVSTVVEGVVASAIGRTGRVLVPAEGTIVSPSRVLALDDTRFVVAWNEQLDGEHARTRIAIASATGDALVRTVFETVEEIVQPIAVTVSGGDIWIARFERRLDALEASILRVAHLDTTLQRIDPDRWLGGWGGFSPRNLSLVALDGRPWLVWVSADTRYGRLHVVHASPLPLEACGRDVGAAAIELPSTWRGELDLVAAASRTSIWLAVASNYPTSEATTYALTLP